jgi:hypothetical protein
MIRTVAEYEQFLISKHNWAQATGFTPGPLHQRHFGFQKVMIDWAAKQGRAAVFADTGLGKTGIQIELSRQVAQHTSRPVLIAAPLAVAEQTIEEGALLDVPIRYARTQEEADRLDNPVIITNYDRIEGFVPGRWAGIVLDESSVLKSYTGKTKQFLVGAFRETPYRFACTATPAPNDHIELGNHAEFLGVMSSSEMLMQYFINDTMVAGGYRLKNHSEQSFWEWVASWAACVSKPSDLGFSDDGYELPPLAITAHTVAVDYATAWAEGQLFHTEHLNATKLWKDKRTTMHDRVRMAAQLVAAEPEESWIVWCDTNEEASLLMQLLPVGAVEVRGNDKPADKIAKMTAFRSGQARYMVTKSKIAGFGLNWQHCARQCFVGMTYSFEAFYQALRRSYRFGQRRPVQAHLIVAETEGNVLARVEEKKAAHREMQEKLTAAMRVSGLLAGQYQHLRTYEAPHRMYIPSWLHSKAA